MAMPAKQVVPQVQQKTLRLGVLKGKVAHPRWIHVYGDSGVGKTSLGASANAPIFIDVEQGSLNVDTARFVFDEATGRTRPLGFEEFMEAVRAIEREGFPTYKTLVIDTLDAVEALIWEYVCQKHGKEHISDFGFGKGENIVALDEWRKLIAALERIRAKGMSVLTLSHAIVKRRDDPDGDGWDRYVLKLHDKASGLVKERADMVLFAKRDITRVKKDGKTRGVATDARYLYTTWTPAYDAKNRDDLPEEIPLDWSELSKAIAAARPVDPKAIVEAIHSKSETLKQAGLLEQVTELLAKAGDDAVKLSKLNTWINAKLAEAGIEEK